MRDNILDLAWINQNMSRKFDSFKHLAVEKFDFTIAILGTLSSLLLICILIFILADTAYRYIEAPLLLLIGCIVYLKVYGNSTTTQIKYNLEKISTNIRFKKTTDLAFVLMCICVILSIALRPEPYTRPITYFIFILLMISVLTLETLLISIDRKRAAILLIKYSILFLFLRWIPQILFQDLGGFDPYWHEWFTDSIVTSGLIPTNEAYSFVPAMHIIISSIMLLLNSDYKISSMIGICILQVASYTFVYLLGSHVCNQRIGLLAVLLLGVADMQLQYGIWIRPIIVGIIIITPIYYLLIEKGTQQNKGAIYILVILLSFSAIITHAIAAMTLIIILSIISVGPPIFRLLFCEKNNAEQYYSVGTYLLILVIIMTIGWWLFASGHFNGLLSFINRGFIVEDWVPSTTASNYIDNYPLEFNLNTLALNLFSGFAVTGSLYLMNSKIRCQKSFTIVLIGFLLMAFLFTSLVLGLSAILPYRWYPTYQMVMALPASIGVFLFSRIVQSKYGQIIIIIFVVSFFSFFSVTNAFVNSDSPLYTKNINIRYNFYDSENSAITTISSNYNGTISLDYYYLHPLLISQKNSNNFSDLSDQLKSQDFTDIEGLAMIREEITKKPFNADGTYRLDYDLRSVFEYQKFNQIYDSKSVYGYLQE